MSTAPATAASQVKGNGARLRNLVIGALFAAVLLIRKILHIRRNAQSWMAFRIFLGFAGAALVILPLSLWNSWLAAIAGLGMFLAAILLPPAKSQNISRRQSPRTWRSGYRKWWKISAGQCRRSASSTFCRRGANLGSRCKLSAAARDSCARNHVRECVAKKGSLDFASSMVR